MPPHPSPNPCPHPPLPAPSLVEPPSQHPCHGHQSPHLLPNPFPPPFGRGLGGCVGRAGVWEGRVWEGGGARWRAACWVVEVPWECGLLAGLACLSREWSRPRPFLLHLASRLFFLSLVLLWVFSSSFSSCSFSLFRLSSGSSWSSPSFCEAPRWSVGGVWTGSGCAVTCGVIF
jgi:hypothetical protein